MKDGTFNSQRLATNLTNLLDSWVGNISYPEDFLSSFTVDLANESSLNPR